MEAKAGIFSVHRVECPFHRAGSRYNMAPERANIQGVGMIELSRQMVAYGIIGLAFVIGLPWIAYVLRNRKRASLRRRGVKTYGH